MEWRQEKDKLIVKSIEGEFYFNMPSNFNLKKVHPDLLKLTEMVLFSPWHDDILKDYIFTRKQGNKIGLAFSGGADSCAAYCLLPKDSTIPYYHKRTGGDRLMRQENPHKVIRDNKIDCVIIGSNHESIRTYYELFNGFSTDLAVLAGLILLADQLDLGYLSTGMMLESTFIEKGYKFRDFDKTKYWTQWSKVFKDAGLELFFPVITCSEVLNMKILEENNIQSISCIRGINEWCNKCYKCFRKNCISNAGVIYNDEAKKILSHRPLKQGASLVYAMNKFNLDIPELSEYKGLDLSWLEGYYEPAIRLMPEKYQNYLKRQLQQYSVPMENDKIREFNLENIQKGGQNNEEKE